MTDAEMEAGVPPVAPEEPTVDAGDVPVEPDAKRPRVEDGQTGEGDANKAAPEAEADVAIDGDKIPAATTDPITIGYKTFTSGRECYNYFHHIISKYRKNQNLNDYEFHNVYELIRLGHPEAERKLSPKVSGIQIRDVYAAGVPSSCFHLLREDGATEDVSYRKCVSNLFAEMKDVLAASSRQGGNKRGGGRGGGRRGGGRRGGGRGRR